MLHKPTTNRWSESNRASLHQTQCGSVLVLAAALGSVFGSLAPWWPVAALSASLLVSAVVFASMELRASA